MNTIGLCVNIIGMIIMLIHPIPTFGKRMSIELEDETYLYKVNVTVREYDKF